MRNDKDCGGNIKYNGGSYTEPKAVKKWKVEGKRSMSGEHTTRKQL